MVFTICLAGYLNIFFSTSKAFKILLHHYLAGFTDLHITSL